jgi:predicted O-methyltransferase YrrM
MNGTTLEKVARFAASMIARPIDIPRYVVSRSRTPLEIGVPWFSFAAIDFLRGFLRPHMKAFEYGSGGSTIFFAQHVDQVVSAEDSGEWIARVRRALVERELTNATLLSRPYDFWNPIDFDRSSYLLSLEDRFDLIAIDGTECEVKVRPVCFSRAQQFIAPGGIIVVDDAWRYPELRAISQAKEWLEFRSCGPCRPGVTTTEIFFY